jgi:Family of unknown function (DUF6311)
MRSPKFLSREQVLFAAVVTIVPILLCGFMFGFDIPLASAEFWVRPKNDMIAMTAAYEAYVRQPWSWPITMVSGLLPKPFSIVFSDSIPWVSILLKASGLGPYFNPLGVFLMLSYPLQAWGMVALLRSLGVKDKVPLAIGGLIALLFPTWIARQFGHIALCGHWLILFSLALTVSSARLGLTWKRVGGFAALAALATGVHAYHLAPIAACFGAALLAELLQRRGGAWTRVPLAAVAVLASVGVPALFLGYGEGSGPTGGAAAIGLYSMNVLGPVWPQASNLFGQYWTGGWYRGTLDPNGGQYFEGFQFMGVGPLLLVLAMLAAMAWGVLRGRRPEAGVVARWTPLALCMLGLTLWAIGWVVYVGPAHLFDIPKPSGKVAEIVGGYRAHGRFFWAPGYLLMALGIVWASRLPRRLGLGLLAAALAIQAYDSSPLRQGVRYVFAAPDVLDMPVAFANSPAIRGRPWVFRPTYFCSPNPLDERVISQMALIAVRTGGTSNTFATARSNDASCEVVPPELTMDAAPGDRRMTIVMANGKMEGGDLQPIAQRTDCYRFKRGVVCGRDLADIQGLSPVLPGELATERPPLLSIRLDQTPKSPALISGWANLDPGGKGIWTLGPKALFTLDAPKTIGPNGFFVDIVAIGFSDQPVRPQRVTLYAEGKRLETQNIDTGNFYTYRFKIPNGAVKPGQPVRFLFDLPDARASKNDPRVLGIGVQEIRVVQ